MDIAFVVWVIVASAVGLNGFAAGVTAALYAWSSRRKRGARVLIAAGAAGFFPFSFLIPTFFSQLSSESGEAFYLAAACAVLFLVATVIALPGAIIMSRKLEGAGDRFLAFE